MKSKKGLLSSGIAIISAAVPMLVNGTYLEGGILAAIGVGLVAVYDHLDDTVKGTPQLPEGVDEQFFKDVAEQLADTAKNSGVSVNSSGAAAAAFGATDDRTAEHPVKEPPQRADPPEDEKPDKKGDR